MTKLSLFRSGLLASTLLMTIPAVARADVSAAEASAMQGQIRGWLQGLLGPSVPIGSNPVRVTPEGDHYRLSVDVAGQYGSTAKVTGDPVTALIKPIDANRWAVDDLKMPSPLRIENTGDGKDVFKSSSAKIAEQTTSGVVDLSLATTSSLDTTMRGYTAITETATGSKTSHVDHSVTHSTLQPAGDGRVNVLFEGTGEHLTSDSALPDGSPLKVAADSFKVGGHLDKVSFTQIGAAIKLGTGLIPLLQASASSKQDSLPPAAKAPLHAMVVAVRDALGGMEESVSLEKLRIDSSDFKGSMAHVGMGLGFGAPQGRLDAHLLFEVDGIDSPMVPPGVYRDYLPKHVSMRPRISGIPAADVAQLMDHAIDSNGSDSDALAAEAMGLLAKGPLAIGLDDVSLDLGPAALKASGSVSISSIANYSGQAQIRVTGFDALMQQANRRPELKQGAPVLIFLKGIGKQDGASMIWNITYQNNALTVNGTDLSGMIPSGAGKN